MSENSVQPSKFNFLKKGQGISRFGTITYQKAKSQKTMDDGNEVESSMSETRQFELMEQAIDQSLPSQSSLFQQFYQSNSKQSSPRIVEVVEKEVQRPAAGMDKSQKSQSSSGPRPGDTSAESGSISSVGTSEWPVNLAPRVQNGTPASISTPSVPSTSPFQPIPQYSAPQPPPTSLGLSPINPEYVPEPGQRIPQYTPQQFPQNDPRVQNLVGEVRGIMERLNNDYMAFQKRRDTMLAQLRHTAAELEEMKTKKEMEISIEKQQFEELKRVELEDIRTSREALQKQRLALEKRESDRVVKLKSEIVELQNDVCERDSRISSQRARIRQLEEDGKIKKDGLIEADEERGRLRDRCRSLETANAQLRLKQTTSQQTLKSRAAKENEMPYGVNQKSQKSVRFELNSNSNRGPFMRTQDHVTQTSFLVPEEAVNKGTTPFTPLQTTPGGLTIELERRTPDGTLEQHYKNGTVVKQFGDGSASSFAYANGDNRVVGNDGTETYTYAATGMTTVTYSNGTQLIKYGDGREETHSVLSDGSKQTILKDGTILTTHVDGAQTCIFPDASKEYRCKQFKRREWPSGDVKIIYADGSEETRYKDGRIRIKDAQKNLIKYAYTDDEAL